MKKITKLLMSKEYYEETIKRAKEAIDGFERIIELHKEMKPCRLFKKKMIRYEKEFNELNDRKKFWEEYLEELEYEKKRLFP